MVSPVFEIALPSRPHRSVVVVIVIIAIVIIAIINIIIVITIIIAIITTSNNSTAVSSSIGIIPSADGGRDDDSCPTPSPLKRPEQAPRDSSTRARPRTPVRAHTHSHACARDVGPQLLGHDLWGPR